MEEANDLYLGNHKLERIAQRLKEENEYVRTLKARVLQHLVANACNSQLMEILLDINNDPRRPAYKHYDVLSPGLRNRMPELTPEHSLSGANTIDSIKLYKLEAETTHTPYHLPSPSVLPIDLQDLDNPLGCMTPTHEDEYLSAMDSALDALPLPSIEPNRASNGNAVLDPNVDIRPRHWELPTSEDFAHHHPASVHNWLGRNQPQIAAEKERLKAQDKDGDKTSERGGRSPAPRATPTAATGSKRKAKDKIKKEDIPFENLDDEIGFDPAEEATLGSSKKRKNDDDAYRPKGGRSKGGGSKRKRDRESAGGEAEETSAKKVKKTVPEAED